MDIAPRTIMHIDMNAFFASVEQAANPALRDRPIAVIGSKHRTVVLTASYSAKRAGVKTGATLYEARQRCPTVQLVCSDPDKYMDTSRAIMKMLERFTPLVEVASIDEAFLDVTGSLYLFSSAERIARMIKADIKARYDLSCSIGVAPNKLLAKLAAEQQKPDGLVIIKPEDVPQCLAHVPLGDVCGIGPRTAAFFQQRGIRTCGELQRVPPEYLRRHFGVTGAWLHDAAFGRDTSPVVPADRTADPKSVGHSMTFEHNAETRAEVAVYLQQLSEMVGRRMRAAHLRGTTVAVTVRYASFRSQTVRHTVPAALCRGDEIFHAAALIWSRMPMPEPVRLAGVAVSNLQVHAEQLALFPGEQRRLHLAQAQDVINDRYGEYTLFPAALLQRTQRARVIAPSWRPAGLRSGC